MHLVRQGGLGPDPLILSNRCGRGGSGDSRRGSGRFAGRPQRASARPEGTGLGAQPAAQPARSRPKGRKERPDTIVRLGENSHFVLTGLSGTNTKPTTTLSVIVGEIWVMLNSALNGGSFDVETPVGVAAVRGSSVSVDYDLTSDSVIVSCLEGDCSLRNQAGAVNLQAEQETHIARRNQAPSAARTMDPARLERWRKYVKESDRFISAAATRLARTWTAPGYNATRNALQTQVPRSLTKVSGFETRVGTLSALPTNILTRLPPNQQTLVATALTARAEGTLIRPPTLTQRP